MVVSGRFSERPGELCSRPLLVTPIKQGVRVSADSRNQLAISKGIGRLNLALTSDDLPTSSVQFCMRR
jgi:hypothetical protein